MHFTGTTILRVKDGQIAEEIGLDDGVTVLDVRQPGEFDGSHVRGALNIALHELSERIAEIPADHELWIHCASGYRASIAAALLDRHDRRVVLVDDDFGSAEKLKITTST